jgi:lysophospholipase L1-like esterase
VRWTRRRLQVAGSLGLTLVLGAVALLSLYRLVWSRSVHDAGPEAEQAWRRAQVEEVDAGIQARCAAGKAAGTVRVLCVGSSQTWGAGAAAPGEGFVEVLERRLRASAPPGRVLECVNAGVSGLNSAWLWRLYRERWLALEPDVVVVNLSNNDQRADVFERALTSLLDVDERLGIETVFALEANSAEASPAELALHATMRRVGEARGIPVVDVHAYLKERRGAGFLWWDFVHPTSLGHGLIAEALEPAVRAAIERSVADR